jgi:hypothetical protein
MEHQIHRILTPRILRSRVVQLFGPDVYFRLVQIVCVCVRVLIVDWDPQVKVSFDRIIAAHYHTNENRSLLPIY